MGTCCASPQEGDTNIDCTPVKSNPKLDRMRKLMAENDLVAFVCFHEDQHDSEYIAPCDERIGFISGFTGSNAICVVTHTEARCWTDGRYYLQAEQQLEQGWTMMKWDRQTPNWFTWTAS